MSTPQYGFEDNFDSRYSNGWRWFILCSGLANLRFVRSLLGGVWELWYIGPCGEAIWHPVTEVSVAPRRPSPFIIRFEVHDAGKPKRSKE